jgi:hypothetical protein
MNSNKHENVLIILFSVLKYTEIYRYEFKLKIDIQVILMLMLIEIIHFLLINVK